MPPDTHAALLPTVRIPRVLYIEANEDGTVGGSHQVLFDMLSVLDRKRFEPLVLFYQKNRFGEALNSVGVSVINWDDVREAERNVQNSGTRIGKLVALACNIRRRKAFLEEKGIDLVHMNNSPRTGRTDWLPAAFLARTPIVASARGDARPLPGRGIRASVHRWLMTRFDRVIAITEFIAAAWRAQGVADEKVVVVHDGVNPTRVRAEGLRSREEIRQDLGVPKGRLLVTMVGNIRHWKGQHVVLEALHRVDPAVLAQLFVTFIGAAREEDQDYLDRLKSSAEEWGIADSVSFLGVRTDVPEILTAADIAVHASVLPEPGGMVILEAMTYGTPVICANQGGPLDFLKPGVGLAHDVEDPSQLAAHLTTLALSPELRERMVDEARIRARDFSIEHTARKMEAVYDQVLGQSG